MDIDRLQSLKKAFESAYNDFLIFFDVSIILAIQYLIGCDFVGGDEFTVAGIIDKIVDECKTKTVSAFRRIEK